MHGADKSGRPVRRGEAVCFFSEISTCLAGIEAADPKQIEWVWIVAEERYATPTEIADPCRGRG